MQPIPPHAGSRIYYVRGQRVMLDADLAEIYGVETRALNQAVRRNIERFPDDFRFELTRVEIARISQIVIPSGPTSKIKYANRVSAYTEHGAVMLAAVLNSSRAVQASVAISRAFVSLRRLTFGRRELASRLKELELRVGTHDGEIKHLFDALGELIDAPIPKPRQVGFHISKE
ncbi:MAG: ORF6N domain-containing protein [Elusimicrobiota bacterium]